MNLMCLCAPLLMSPALLMRTPRRFPLQLRIISGRHLDHELDEPLIYIPWRWRPSDFTHCDLVAHESLVMCHLELGSKDDTPTPHDDEGTHDPGSVCLHSYLTEGSVRLCAHSLHFSSKVKVKCTTITSRFIGANRPCAHHFPWVGNSRPTSNKLPLQIRNTAFFARYFRLKRASVKDFRSRTTSLGSQEFVENVFTPFLWSSNASVRFCCGDEARVPHSCCFCPSVFAV